MTIDNPVADDGIGLPVMVPYSKEKNICAKEVTPEDARRGLAKIISGLQKEKAPLACVKDCKIKVIGKMDVKKAPVSFWKSLALFIQAAIS